MAPLRPLLLCLALLAPASALRAETVLLMAEEAGCMWCARWNAEIAPAYPKTAEGRAAPLLRHDLGDPLPDGIELAAKVRFTPTFVLLQDGREVARIEGYPGEHFFWGLLAQMLENAGVDIGTGG